MGGPGVGGEEAGAGGPLQGYGGVVEQTRVEWSAPPAPAVVAPPAPLAAVPPHAPSPHIANVPLPQASFPAARPAASLPSESGAPATGPLRRGDKAAPRSLASTVSLTHEPAPTPSFKLNLPSMPGTGAAVAAPSGVGSGAAPARSAPAHPASSSRVVLKPYSALRLAEEAGAATSAGPKPATLVSTTSAAPTPAPPPSQLDEERRRADDRVPPSVHAGGEGAHFQPHVSSSAEASACLAGQVPGSYITWHVPHSPTRYWITFLTPVTGSVKDVAVTRGADGSFTLPQSLDPSGTRFPSLAALIDTNRARYRLSNTPLSVQQEDEGKEGVQDEGEEEVLYEGEEDGRVEGEEGVQAEAEDNDVVEAALTEEGTVLPPSSTQVLRPSVGEGPPDSLSPLRVGGPLPGSAVSGGGTPLYVSTASPSRVAAWTRSQGSSVAGLTAALSHGSPPPVQQPPPVPSLPTAQASTALGVGYAGQPPSPGSPESGTFRRVSPSPPARAPDVRPASSVAGAVSLASLVTRAAGVFKAKGVGSAPGTSVPPHLRRKMMTAGYAGV